jgi:hypothetical protein
MTARIHKTFNLLAGLHFNNQYYINSYEFEMTFNVETESIIEQNIALERIHYYLYECLKHCVFVNENNVNAIDKYSTIDMSVCTLPEEPYDQIIGIMLMSKLNAVAEGRLVITDIIISSDMSAGVSCLHSIEESMGPFVEKNWWNDSTQRINNLTKNKKVIRLAKLKNEWQDVYLDWADKAPAPETTAAEIIFTNFDKTDR